MNEISRRLYNAIQRPAIRSGRRSRSNHPSAASVEVPCPISGTKILGGCLRQEYYRLTGEQSATDINPNWSMAAILGNTYQDTVRNLMLNNGFRMELDLIAEEHPIYVEDIDLSGRIDLVFWDRKNKEIMGIEVKSVGDYKSKKTIVEPDIEHVMQSMIYLDYYRKSIPKGMAHINKWYILYVARSEGWHLKNQKVNSSPFTNIWDFYITLEPDGSPTVWGPKGSNHIKDVTLEKIYERYEQLSLAVKEGKIPDRDFDLQYPEDKLTGLYKLGKMEFKKDQAVMESWIKRGAQEGQLALQMGDSQCRFCAWQSKCWNLEDDSETSGLFDLPLVEGEPSGVETKKTLL